MSYPLQNQVIPAGPVPLWAPYYGASIGEAAGRFFKKYATFTGRASRSEYWWWMLISVLVSIVLQIILTVGGSAGATPTSGAAAPSPGAMSGIILLMIWALATLVPALALTIRRLHDANFSGWLILIGLVPFLGALALLVMTILPSSPAGQRFDQPGV